MKICKSKMGSKNFIWFPTWLNCITWTKGNLKIYRWGYWNFEFKTKGENK